MSRIEGLFEGFLKDEIDTDQELTPKQILDLKKSFYGGAISAINEAAPLIGVLTSLLHRRENGEDSKLKSKLEEIDKFIHEKVRQEFPELAEKIKVVSPDIGDGAQLFHAFEKMILKQFNQEFKDMKDDVVDFSRVHFPREKAHTHSEQESTHTH